MAPLQSFASDPARPLKYTGTMGSAGRAGGATTRHASCSQPTNGPGIAERRSALKDVLLCLRGPPWTPVNLPFPKEKPVKKILSAKLKVKKETLLVLAEKLLAPVAAADGWEDTVNDATCDYCIRRPSN
jgi:hypothetical protein